MYFDFNRSVLRIFNTILVFTFIYTCTATALYNRYDLNLENNKINYINETNIDNIVDNYLKELEFLQKEIKRDKNSNVVLPYNKEQVIDKITDDIIKLTKDNTYFKKYICKPKDMFFSRFMTYSSLTGVYIAPFGEVNYNKEPPLFCDIPTIVHEIGHSLGLMRESDANYFAAYVLLNSNDKYLKYSGYCFIENLNFFVSISKGKEIKQIKSINVLGNDSMLDIAFWSNAPRPLDKLSNIINNTYLKIQGVNSGVNSYNEPYLYYYIPDKNDKSKFKIKLSPVQKIIINNYI